MVRWYPVGSFPCGSVLAGYRRLTGLVFILCSLLMFTFVNAHGYSWVCSVALWEQVDGHLPSILGNLAGPGREGETVAVYREGLFIGLCFWDFIDSDPDMSLWGFFPAHGQAGERAH